MRRSTKRFRGAASADPDVRQLWQEILVERRWGASNFVRLVCDLGPLRQSLDRDAAGDVVWILNGPGLYHQLLLEQAWSPDSFCTWLSETMHTQLLGRPPRRPRTTH